VANNGTCSLAMIAIDPNTTGTVQILDGTTPAWVPMSAGDEEDFSNTPVALGTNLTLNFTGTGTAYVVMSPIK